MTIRVALLVLAMALPAFYLAAEESPGDRAAQALQNGKFDDALKLLTQGLEAEPKNIKLLDSRAKVYLELGKRELAADWSRIADIDPTKAAILRRAGAEYFFAGNFDASIAAFDAYAKHFPDQSPQLWERGISLYYAKRYADGRKQFEEHQTVNPHDVENAAWHFICAAKEMGVEKARKALIDIDTGRDARVPMKQVYLLFKGDGKPEDVLAAAAAGNPPPDVLKGHMCYAHLYLGLYFEALGDDKKAREHMEKAAVEFAQDHYMGQVARVHWELMKSKK